jgi:hypothetical protein
VIYEFSSGGDWSTAVIDAGVRVLVLCECPLRMFWRKAADVEVGDLVALDEDGEPLPIGDDMICFRRVIKITD